MVLMSAELGTDAGMMLLTSMRRKYQLRIAWRLWVLPISRRMRKRMVRKRRKEAWREEDLQVRVARLNCVWVRGGLGVDDVAAVEIVVGGEVEPCMMLHV